MAELKTAEAVRSHAENFELWSVDFLDKKGRVAGGWKNTRQVKLRFIDDSIAVLSRAEFSKLDDCKFKPSFRTYALDFGLF